jgi:DNA topoisomerase-3
MQLIISEKPSVATTIAQVLGNGAARRQDGYFQTKDYYITFLFGHLFTLWDAKEYDPKYQVWDVANLPIIPNEFKYKLIDDAGVKKQFKIVQELVNRPEVTAIINAADSDREGELLGKEVIKATGTTKPIKRLWVSSHTPEDLQAGFAALRSDADLKPLELAGYSRQWADWLFGINLTVAATKLFAPARTVLNVGRVILPTVYLVYLRDREIKNFKPRKYFELSGIFKTDIGTYEGLYILDKKTQFETELELQAIIKAVEGQPGKVISVQSKKVTQGPGKLFSLTDLQGYITSKYAGFTAEKVLRLAQSLYEKQHITYPRTASRYLDNSQAETARKVLEKTASFFPGADITFKKSKQVFDSSKVDSHPALMPTNLTPKPGGLLPDEKIVYLEIVKRFVAHFMPPAEYEQTEAITKVASHKFITKGKVLIKPGWKKLYGGKAEPEEDAGQELQTKLTAGQPVKNLTVKTVAKETKPPAHYTVKTLLEAMQTCGRDVADDDLEILKGYSIGTSATRAAILKKVEKVGYLQLKGKSYYITEMGANLVKIFPVKEMLEPDFTGRLEKQLKEMEKGQYSQDEFIRQVEDLVILGIKKMKGVEGQIGKAAPQSLVIGKCPVCGQAVVEKDKFFGCSGWKAGCKFSIWKENALLVKNGIKTVPKTLIKALLSGKETTVKLGNKKVPVSLSQTGERWGLMFSFAESEIASLGNCPECGKPVIEISKGFSCSGYKEGCKFVLWKEDRWFGAMGKKITATMAKNFLGQRPVLVKGLKSKTGKVFDAAIKMVKKANGFWGFEFDSNQAGKGK